mgnify:CR=1 FL=1
MRCLRQRRHRRRWYLKGADNTPYEKIGDEVRSLADEVPFDIPDSWEWVRFGNIVANYDSKRRPVTKEQRKNEHGYYDYYGATGAIDRVDDYIFEGEYLMIGEDGGNFFTERDNAFIASGRFWANNHVHIVQPILCDIHFLKHFLDSCNLPKMGLINGIAVPKLNQEHLNSILVPLPPLSEQEAIVAELSKYAPLLDEYQLAYSEIKLLNDSFPERLKKSILQEAVQGKLVPQDPSDEPAEALLERIRAEKQRLIKEGKIKKDKHESVIFRRDNSHYEKRGSEEVCIDDEIPFEVPSSWALIRLDDIGIYRKGPFGSSLTKSMFVPKGADTVKVYEQKNAIQKDHTLGTYYITRQYYESKMKSFTVEPGDILVSCAGTIGETYILPEQIELGIINQALMRMTIFAPIDLDYFLLYFDYVLKQAAKETSKGSAIKNIPPFEIFKKLILPLPPLEEQKRIVEKVRELESLCNSLYA